MFAQSMKRHKAKNDPFSKPARTVGLTGTKTGKKKWCDTECFILIGVVAAFMAMMFVSQW